MEYEVSDSSGTDDDLPPSNQNRLVRRGRAPGSGQSAVISATYSRVQADMEAQIHHLEQEAYRAVLRAFKAQSDQLSWDKEGLITELRKELRVSDDEHREILTLVNRDDIIQRIREWREAGGQQVPRFIASQSVHDVLSSPTVSASRKKQKTSLVYPTGPPRNQHFNNRGSAYDDKEIGKEVWTRWPEDNNFYKAVITRYNPAEARHALVYDMNTENETWEWVDLNAMAPEDLRWEVEDPGISHGRPGHVMKKSMSHGGLISSSVRGRGSTKDQSKREFFRTQNGIARKLSDNIELLNTESLVKEVERVFGVSYPDPLELEKAKKMLKEHEQALVDAIARLADASDGESDGDPRFLHGQAMEEQE
uniref:ENT domain-containing protein n=1 Tax=Populus davidiana TaxID=266767 RepID=A0A6M2EGM8_9ROSI